MSVKMPGWLRHDNMCRHRRSHGVMGCDCYIGRKLLDDPYALLSDDQRALLIGHLKLAKLAYRALQHEAEDNLDKYRAEQPVHRSRPAWPASPEGAWPRAEEQLINMIAEYRMMADELMDLRWEL